MAINFFENNVLVKWSPKYIFFSFSQEIYEKRGAHLIMLSYLSAWQLTFSKMIFLQRAWLFLGRILSHPKPPNTSTIDHICQNRKKLMSTPKQVKLHGCMIVWKLVKIFLIAQHFLGISSGLMLNCSPYECRTFKKIREKIAKFSDFRSVSKFWTFIANYKIYFEFFYEDKNQNLGHLWSFYVQISYFWY